MKKTKKNLLKKGLPGFLAAVMTIGLLSVCGTPLTVKAEGTSTINSMNFDTSFLVPESKWKAGGYKVYFGQYNDTPTAFRVLKNGNNDDTMLLDCDTILLVKLFNAGDTPNAGSDAINKWNNCDLELWLNDENYYENASVFTTLEKNAIVSTTLSAKSTYYNGYTPCKDYDATDYVYLLSADEAFNVYYADSTARVKTGGSDSSGSWWLRSSMWNDTTHVASVGGTGNFFNGSMANSAADKIGVSPAFNISRSSVLFTSENTLSKSSAALTKVTSDSTATEWKLTLSDTDKGIQVTNGKTVVKSGDTITVPYTYTGSGVSQISVMITSGEYTASGTEILYYGKLDTALSDETREGTGTFTLPNDLPDGYKMYILAEDANGANYTDYASAPVEITAIEAVEAPTSNLSDTTFTANRSLTLSSATEGAAIYYTMTIDGSEPAEPTLSSTMFTAEVPITLEGVAGETKTIKIKAIAVKSGMLDSSVTALEYVIQIPAQDTGKVEVASYEESENTASVHLANTEEEIRSAVLTDADKEELAAGKDINVWIEAKDNNTVVSQTDKDLITEKMPADYQVGAYLDINLWKQVEGESAVKVTNIQNGKVKVSIKVPTELQKDGRGYKVIRIHAGVAAVLDTDFDAAYYRVTFETDRFSTYALVYSDDNDNDDNDDYDIDDRDNDTTENGKENTVTTAPKTGDPNNLTACFTALLASFGGMAVLVVYKRKKFSYDKSDGK
jgi:hypothetical protein